MVLAGWITNDFTSATLANKEKISKLSPERLSRLLPAASKVPGIPGAHVCALEIAGEGLDQVVPARDLPRRQVLQPGASSVGEEQGEVSDDEVVVVRSTQLAGQTVVREPQFRSRFPRVLCDSSRGSEPGRERSQSDGPTRGENGTDTGGY